MSQKSKGKKLRASSDETKTTAEIENQPPCHIHDKANSREVEDIRQKVCVNDLLLTKHADGNHYCLFHLPTKDKNRTRFKQIFRTRLAWVKKEIIKTEELPEAEREKVKRKLSYDFRYVWFPSEVNLIGYKFEADASFNSATFSARASFNSATFSADASFHSVTFSDDASFRSTTFESGASFNSTTFSARASFGSAKFLVGIAFSSAIFSADAYFSSVTFSGDASFRLATFEAGTSFRSAEFLETSQVFFRQTRFSGNIDLQYAVFAGYVAFEGKLGEIVFLYNKERNQETVLDLQNARLEKPERISFHRVRLRPNWFVNVDSRKMVFTDVEWDNVKNNYNNENIKAELKSLEERKLEKSKQLFKIACRQLAENAETNNNYEIASNFRRMAMETEWFEKKEEIIDLLKHSKSKSIKILEFLRKTRDLFIHGIYRFSSSYGESWGRATVILLIILFSFAIIYTLTSFQNCPKDEPVSTNINECKNTPDKCRCKSGGLDLSEAIRQSLAIATFQNVEYRRPTSGASEFWITLEKILAPLQAALLALAIRRKFMR